MVTVVELLAWSREVERADDDDEVWEVFDQRIQQRSAEVWASIVAALQQLRDPATWSSDDERHVGEPSVVLDLSTVIQALAKDSKWTVEVAERSRTDDVVASAFVRAFWSDRASDIYRLLGVEPVARAWVQYRSDDTAWHWWAVSLVHDLVCPVVRPGTLTVDDAWALCRELAARCDEVVDEAEYDGLPISMVGASPLEDLFRRDPSTFLALAARDAPTDRKLHEALRSVWPDPRTWIRGTR